MRTAEFLENGNAPVICAALTAATPDDVDPGPAVIVRDLHGKILALVPGRAVAAALCSRTRALHLEDIDDPDQGLMGAGRSDLVGPLDLVSLMDRCRIRNLQVLNHGSLVGLISARDVAKVQASRSRSPTRLGTA